MYIIRDPWISPFWEMINTFWITNFAFWSTTRGSRGKVKGVRTPPPPEMTCGFLIQLVFCKKKKTMWFIGVELERETSAPPPKKKNPSRNYCVAKISCYKGNAYVWVGQLGWHWHNLQSSGFFFSGKGEKERLIHLFHIYLPRSSPFLEYTVYNIQHVHQSYSIIWSRGSSDKSARE